MDSKTIKMMKQASEMQAQAYDLLEKAASIITACGCEDGNCAVGDPAAATIVAPVATPVGSPVPGMGSPEPVLVLKLAEKTAALTILSKVAEELEGNEDETIKKMSQEVKDIADAIDKSARVLEDGLEDGTQVDRLVDEMKDSFAGKVYDKGTPQGEASARAIQHFNSDKTMEVQNLVGKYPKVEGAR